MRYVCISLWVLLSFTSFVLAESKHSQDMARRQVWAKELGRWSRYCLQKNEGQEQLFEGCNQRVNGIRAAQALFRLIRLDGFIQPHQEVMQAVDVQQWLKNKAFKTLSYNQTTRTDGSEWHCEVNWGAGTRRDMCRNPRIFQC